MPDHKEFSYSLLPALSVNGIIHTKIVEGSFTAGRFYDFIDGLLDQMQPYPLPNSVIIMDNTRIHKDPQVLDLILEWFVVPLFILPHIHTSDFSGMRYMFLPPYSPDYNPIELAFSKIKAFVQQAGELGRDDLDPNVDDSYVYIHLLCAAYSITVNDAENYYCHCGYVV
jgi:transposase